MISSFAIIVVSIVTSHIKEKRMSYAINFRKEMLQLGCCITDDPEDTSFLASLCTWPCLGNCSFHGPDSSYYLRGG